MFGKFKRDVIRVILSSVGMAVALHFQWIVPGGNFLNNVVAGVVLYVVSWVAAFALARR
ncbi:MAG: hypothetical protein WC325_09905 [Candidatus Bathyarchaeia archaeon]|jgi:hypothetical protein